MNPSFLAGLNERQLEAVTLPHQSALILAGAGSGKTRVLTTRIAWLIDSGQTSPAGVLAVTFTNKAAKEMLSRISAMLPINTRGMWVGTFHGLCNRMLRAHHREAKLPQLFQILDSQDQLALIRRLLKAANVDEEKFPPKQAAWYIMQDAIAADGGLKSNARTLGELQQGVFVIKRRVPFDGPQRQRAVHRSAFQVHVIEFAGQAGGDGALAGSGGAVYGNDEFALGWVGH